jgi:hypothetical protein
VTNWQPGDLMAIKHITVETSNTGHMAMISDLPVLVGEWAGIRAYAVSVIDSTSTPHDELDTRELRRDVSGPDKGVGEGTMLIFTDGPDNAVVGHCWSTDPGSKHYTQAEKSLVVARLVM